MNHEGGNMNYIKSLRQYVGTSPIIAPISAIIILNEKNEILLQLRSDKMIGGFRVVE